MYTNTPLKRTQVITEGDNGASERWRRWRRFVFGEFGSEDFAAWCKNTYLAL